MSISSASSSSDETQHAAQQSLYDFITHSLPISSDTTSSPDSSSSTDSSDSSDSSDSDSSSTTSSHSATSHTQSPISISSSSLPSQPFQLASSLPLPSPASSFFSSPWLPKSRMILKRKQHRLALQSRDLSTLESLRSMPSTPTTVSNNSGSSGGGIRDDEGDTEFRVYKAGVRNLVRQEDEGEQGRSNSFIDQSRLTQLMGDVSFCRFSSNTTFETYSNDFIAPRTLFFDLRLCPLGRLETLLFFFHPSTTHSSRSNPRELSQNPNRITSKESPLVQRTLLAIRATPSSSRRSRESFFTP